MRKVLSLFYFCTEIITFPLKGRLSSFIVSGKFPYRVKFYTKRLRREGSKGSEGSEGRVLKMDRPDGRRVLKFDGPLARGLWIAALRCTANTFCRSVSDTQNVVSRFPFRGNEFIMPPVGGKTVKPRLRHQSGDLLESPFMCRPGTNFARLGDPLQGLHMEMHPFCRLRRRLPRRGRF